MGNPAFEPVTDEERLAAAQAAIGSELPHRHVVQWVKINHVKLVLDALVRATRRARGR